jgi:peroxiredoxin
LKNKDSLKQRSKLRVVKTLIGIFLLSALSSVSVVTGQAAEPRKAPELAFTIPGEGEKLLSQYRGKVVALEFILTTCPHCQAASHDLTKYQAELGKRGLQVIDLAINALDNMHKPAEADQMVMDFVRNYQVGFPVGYLPRPQMMSFLGVSPAERMVVPQLVLIDRKGFIHYQTSATSGPDWDSVAKEPAVRQHIEELLSMGPTTNAKSKMVATSVKK